MRKGCSGAAVKPHDDPYANVVNSFMADCFDADVYFGGIVAGADDPPAMGVGNADTAETVRNTYNDCHTAGTHDDAGIYDVVWAVGGKSKQAQANK